MSIVLVSIAATLGPMLLVLGHIVNTFKTLIPLLVLARKGMILLSTAFAASPIGATIVLVMGLVAAVKLLKGNNEELKESFKNVWDDIVFYADQMLSEMSKSFYQFIRDMLRAFKGVGDVFPSLGAKMKELSRTLLDLERKERQLIRTRKLARKETELQAKENDKLTEAVDAAKKSIADIVKAQKKQILVSKEELKLQEEAAEKARKLADEKKMFEESWTQKLQQQVFSRSQLLELEYQNALAEADKFGADRNTIELYYAIERMKIADEEEKEKQRLEKETADKRAAQLEFTKELTISTAADILDVVSQLYGLQIDQVEAKKQADIEAVKNSIMNEEAKAKAIKDIEEGSAKEIKELKRKQAIADKAQAIFGIAINTAVAITTALAQLGPVAGAYAAAAIGVIGAVQAGIVAARPIPLAEGGLVERTQGELILS